MAQNQDFKRDRVRDLIPKRGSVGKALVLEIVRELEPADLALLSADFKPRTGPPPIQQLKAIHHRQAELLAQGMKVIDVARALGTTPARIHQLQKDPTFVEAVAIYRSRLHDQTMDDANRIQGKLVVAAEMALDELNDRLEDPAKRSQIPLGELRKVVEMGGDRTVAPSKSAGPQSTVPSRITLNFSTVLDDKAEKTENPVIDITPNQRPKDKD
jgi:hypothetical protein